MTMCAGAMTVSCLTDLNSNVLTTALSFPAATMTKQTKHFCGIALASCFILTLTAGCRPAVVANKGPEGVGNLSYLAMAYSQYATQRGQPPRNIGDITPSLKKFGDPEELLRSPRDGKPYTIVWGVNRRQKPGTGGSPPVIAYEQEGKNGLRQVVDLSLRVRECSAEEISAMQLSSQ